MRTFNKILATGALVAPVMLGFSGVAVADQGPSFGEGVQAAGAKGAFSAGTASTAGGWDRGGDRHHDGRHHDGRHHDGRGHSGPGYFHHGAVAGPHGAASELVASGFDRHGKAFFIKAGQAAGAHGAASTVTGSHA